MRLPSKIIDISQPLDIDVPYCHMEKLRHLETLPDFSFAVACFPCRINAASRGWTRAVAIIE